MRSLAFRSGTASNRESKTRKTKEERNVDSYLDAVNRLEPDIHPIDPPAFYASASISLRRIADIMEREANARARRFWSWAIFLSTLCVGAAMAVSLFHVI